MLANTVDADPNQNNRLGQNKSLSIFSQQIASLSERLGGENTEEIEHYETEFQALVDHFHQIQLGGAKPLYLSIPMNMIWHIANDVDRCYALLTRRSSDQNSQGYFLSQWVKLIGAESELSNMILMRQLLNSISDRLSAMKQGASQAQPSTKKPEDKRLGVLKSYAAYLMTNIMMWFILFRYLKNSSDVYRFINRWLPDAVIRIRYAKSFVWWGLFSSLAAAGALIMQSDSTLLSPTRFNWKLFLGTFAVIFLPALIENFVIYSLLFPTMPYSLYASRLIVQFCVTALQTLTEELLTRRFLLDDSIDPYTKSLITFASSILFAVAHYKATGISWCVTLSDYIVNFAFYFAFAVTTSIQTHATNGIELAWATHLAHNLAVDIRFFLNQFTYLGAQLVPQNMRGIGSPAGLWQMPENETFRRIFLMSIVKEEIVYPLITSYAIHASLFRPKFSVKPVASPPARQEPSADSVSPSLQIGADSLRLA
ncbi:MAG: hypothetical protein CMF46_00940 [Legionellales bacterium]|nr:hypothetical protein [Legionellales bacterium]|tara:strand:+ start:2533 stop:3981 length:1449 start_codon:yes stop_codon:yes gene_type:complete